MAGENHRDSCDGLLSKYLTGEGRQGVEATKGLIRYMYGILIFVSPGLAPFVRIHTMKAVGLSVIVRTFIIENYLPVVFHSCRRDQNL